MTIDEICVNYRIARNQRAREIETGHDIEGTKGYETTGCYACGGYDTICPKYESMTEIERICGRIMGC